MKSVAMVSSILLFEGRCFFPQWRTVKADDAVFSFQKAMESGVLAPYVNVVSKVEKVDDYTVKITLKQPYTPFLANTMQVCIVNEKAYTEAGDTFGSTITGAGTGPYKVTIYDGNTKIELTLLINITAARLT